MTRDDEYEVMRKALEEIAENWDECVASLARGEMDWYGGYGMCEAARNALARLNEAKAVLGIEK